MEIVRIWTETDISKLQESIIIVDDKFGFCPGCREIGIKLEGLTNCPKCGREFKFVTSREAARGENAIPFIIRTMKKLPGLTFVDYKDYEYTTSRKRAEGLFKGI